MLKKIKKLVLMGSEFTKEEYKEFEIARKKLNIQRCIIISEFLIVLNIALIVVDDFFYKPMRKGTPAFTYLHYSHVAVIILVVIWLLVMYIINHHGKTHQYTLMYHLLGNIVVYWGVFMGLNGQNTSGQITAYITCALALSLGVYLCPIEGFLLYSISLIIFIIGLLSFPMAKVVLYSHIVNATIAILCSYIASNINYFAFIKDFISRKIILSNQRELQANNVKLSEYEKFRTDFFANISHELRTPLNIIYGSQQMIENVLSGKNKSAGNINKYLQMIKQNSFRLMKLVSNLIDMTKIDATIYEIKPMNCDIVSLVEDITISAAGYVESKGISLIFDTEFEEKIISCDPEKIERIMLNLLSNSIKFTPVNGGIYVNIYMRDDRVNISVKDTGIGIPDEMRELIFDRFVQVDKSLDRNREGSGIGLSLVKSLVEMHNGCISVNSVLGQGSEFIVSLPDKTTDCKCGEECINSLENQRSERINIEFSDIYD